MQTHLNHAVKPCRVCHSRMHVKEIPASGDTQEKAWQFLYCQRCGFGPNYAPCYSNLVINTSL